MFSFSYIPRFQMKNIKNNNRKLIENMRNVYNIYNESFNNCIERVKKCER